MTQSPPQAAVIEVRGRELDETGLFRAQSVRMNGTELMCPEDGVLLHEVTMRDGFVLATVTVFVRKIVIGEQP